MITIILIVIVIQKKKFKEQKKINKKMKRVRGSRKYT